MENKNSNKYKVIVYSWNIGDSKRKEEIIACKERSINVIEKLKLVANASEFAFQDLSDFKQRPLKEKLIYAISKKNKAFKWPLIYIVESDDVYELTELESLDSLPKKKVVQVVQEKQPSLVEEKKQKEDEILQKNIEMNKEQQENEIEEKLEIVEGANNKIIDEQIQEKRPTIEYIKEPEKSEIDQIEKESKEIDTIASIVANTSKKNEVDAIQIEKNNENQVGIVDDDDYGWIEAEITDKDLKPEDYFESESAAFIANKLLDYEKTKNQKIEVKNLPEKKQPIQRPEPQHHNFKVFRQNWLYMMQERILRITPEGIQRLDGLDTKEKHSYFEFSVIEIFSADKTKLVLRFTNNGVDTSEFYFAESEAARDMIVKHIVHYASLKGKSIPRATIHV